MPLVAIVYAPNFVFVHHCFLRLCLCVPPRMYNYYHIYSQKRFTGSSLLNIVVKGVSPQYRISFYCLQPHRLCRRGAPHVLLHRTVHVACLSEPTPCTSPPSLRLTAQHFLSHHHTAHDSTAIVSQYLNSLTTFTNLDD